MPARPGVARSDGEEGGAGATEDRSEDRREELAALIAVLVATALLLLWMKFVVF